MCDMLTKINMTDNDLSLLLDSKNALYGDPSSYHSTFKPT